MALHELVLVQDRGGALKRAFGFLNPDSFTWLSIVVKNLMNGEVREYNQYRNAFDDGVYLLFFIDERGNTVGKHKIEVNASTPATQYWVYSYSASLSIFTIDNKTGEEINVMIAEKRLMNPRET